MLDIAEHRRLFAAKLDLLGDDRAGISGAIERDRRNSRYAAVGKRPIDLPLRRYVLQLPQLYPVQGQVHVSKPLHAELDPFNRVERMKIDRDLDVFVRVREIARPDVAQAQDHGSALVGHIQMGDRLVRQHAVVIVVVRFTAPHPEKDAIGGVVGDAGCIGPVPPAQLVVVGARLHGPVAVGLGIVDCLPGGIVEVFTLPRPAVAETDERARFRDGERKSGPLHLHRRWRFECRRRRRVPVHLQYFLLLQLVAERQGSRDCTAARDIGVAQPDTADRQRVRARIEVDRARQRRRRRQRVPAQTAAREIALQGQANKPPDRLRRLAGIL